MLQTHEWVLPSASNANVVACRKCTGAAYMLEQAGVLWTLHSRVFRKAFRAHHDQAHHYYGRAGRRSGWGQVGLGEDGYVI